MKLFDVVLGIIQGATETGRSVRMSVMARSRIDAALVAEHLVDQGLSDNEYSHSITVRGHGSRAAVMAMAA